MPIPEPGAECLIRMRLAGICNTDLEITAGYMAFHGVPGHEFVGTVERGPESLLGRRVVGEINVGCGQCAACRAAMSRHCPNRTVLGIAGRNGVFAEFFTLPAENLLVVPDHVADNEAVFVEPLAAAVEILEQVHLEPANRVCLIGDGKLASLVARVIHGLGCEVTIVGHHESKLAALPAAARFLAGHFKPERNFDVIIEASGHPSGWQTALAAVRPRGTIVLKSTYAGAFDFNPAPLVIDEVTVVGSRCGRFAPALALLASRQIEVRDMINETIPLVDAVSAFVAARRKGARKILLSG